MPRSPVPPVKRVIQSILALTPTEQAAVLLAVEIVKEDRARPGPAPLRAPRAARPRVAVVPAPAADAPPPPPPPAPAPRRRRVAAEPDVLPPGYYDPIAAEAETAETADE